jgi:hypothetical protein
MPTSEEQFVRQKLKDGLAGASLPKNVRLRFRLSGGMPSQRLEDEFTLTGDGKVTARRRDMLVEAKTHLGRRQLDREETRQLFQDLEAGLDHLVRAEDARFLPDSVVGSVTLEAGGESLTLYFPVERDKPIESFGAGNPIQGAFRRIGELSRLTLEEGGKK